jgi:small GTP-binding protein
MNDSSTGLVFKITIIGDSGVGKTSLIKKYTLGTFEKDYISTIGAQFSTYNEKINGDECKLIFWDIAGEDDFNFMRSTFYRASKAAIIVYSLEENDRGKESFNHIIDWYEDIIKYCGEIPVVVFANKVDLVDENTLANEEIQQIVKEVKGIGFYRTSAKTGRRVTEAFHSIIKELYNLHGSKVEIF